ncbi:MAG: zf-HC2 domain-containing protein [Pyrinomonadaceae bacterium]
MKEVCLDIGIVQAFLDSELSHDETARVSAHIATCDNCALMLAEAEEESAFVFPVLAREMDTLVPTQRLWNKINDSIKVEKQNQPFWEKAWAFLRISLASPSMVAAASLLLVFGIVGVLWINKARTDVNTVATVTNRPVVKQSDPTPVIDKTSDKASDPVTAPSTAAVTEPEKAAFKPERAIYRPETKRPAVTDADRTPVVSNGYMPGEESYVKTIATLGKTVEETKGDVLRPSERIAYERDMALVNDTIAKMKTEVKRNPKNETAKQILYSSYQNKIDLLNSVAQKEELVASLK